MKFYDFLLKKAKNDGIEKIIVGAIIYNFNNEVLFLKRKQDDFLGGLLELPSGKMEQNETIEEALKREIKEETNLLLEKIEFYIDSFDYLSASGKKSRELNFNVQVKDIKDIVLTEHDDYKWLNLEQIRNNIDITDEVKESLEIFYFNKK